MEEELKQLMIRLGEAINEALSESEKIADAVEEIRETGHQVSINFEATIAIFGADGTDPGQKAPDPQKSKRSERHPLGRARWTPRDDKFLAELKIKNPDN